MATARYVDLLKQGFMKFETPRLKRGPKPLRPIVACEDCMNWHRQGKHTADTVTRASNRAKRKAEERVVAQ